LFFFLAFLLGLGVFFNASAQVTSDPKFAPWNPSVWLELKVTASDGTTNSYFGSAAALNGSTALIGADGDNSFQGSAYLFTKSNGSWSQGQKLTASDGLAGTNLAIGSYSPTTPFLSVHSLPL
jgi:FG-GAP repeat